MGRNRKRNPRADKSNIPNLENLQSVVRCVKTCQMDYREQLKKGGEGPRSSKSVGSCVTPPIFNDDDDDHHHHHNGLECNFIPDIPGIPPHKLPEALENIQKSKFIENTKQVTSSNLDKSDNEFKIDRDTDNDFEDKDDSLLINTESYISPTTLHQQTLPNNPTTDDEIKVKKNDGVFDIEIIKDDNNLFEEVRSSKISEATEPQLTHDILKAQLQSIIHSSFGLILNKSMKSQPVKFSRYHPYNNKKMVKIPPHKSLEIQSNITHNIATKSCAEFKQHIQVKKEGVDVEIIKNDNDLFEKVRSSKSPVATESQSTHDVLKAQLQPIIHSSFEVIQNKSTKSQYVKYTRYHPYYNKKMVKIPPHKSLEIQSNITHNIATKSCAEFKQHIQVKKEGVDVEIIKNDNNLFEKVRSSKSPVATESQSTHDILKAQLQSIIHSSCGLILNKSMKSQPVKYSRYHPYNNKKMVKIPPHKSLEIQSNITHNIATKSCAELKQHIQVKKDDFDVEIIKDDNDLLDEVRSSKSPEVTVPQLTHDVLKAQLQPIIHSSFEVIQNKSTKSQYVKYTRYHPYYNKKMVKIPPHKSLEIQSNITHNIATKSCAEFKQHIQVKKEGVDVEIIKNDNNLFEKVRSSKSPVATESQSTHDILKAQLQSIIHSSCGLILNKSMKSQPVKYSRYHPYNNKKMVKIPPHKSLEIQSNITHNIATKSCAELKQHIQVKKDDFDVEIIKDDNDLLDEVRSSKSPEVTVPQLTHDVLKAQLQPIIHSSFEVIQNKSTKSQYVKYTRYHPYYNKKMVKIPPHKSLEIQSNITHNIATKSCAEFKQHIQVKKEGVDVEIIKNDNNLFEKVRSSKSPVATESQSTHDILKAQLQSIIHSSCGLILNKSMKSQPVKYSRYHPYNNKKMVKIPPHKSLEIQSNITHNIATKSCAELKQHIQVKKDDFDVEIIKDDNDLLDEVRSSKSPEVTVPQLTHDVLKAQLQPIIHSSFEVIQNKSTKSQYVKYTRYHPYYNKKMVKIPPHKSLEIQSNITHNIATKSCAEFKQHIQVKKEGVDVEIIKNDNNLFEKVRSSKSPVATESQSTHDVLKAQLQPIIHSSFGLIQKKSTKSKFVKYSRYHPYKKE